MRYDILNQDHQNHRSAELQTELQQQKAETKLKIMKIFEKNPKKIRFGFSTQMQTRTGGIHGLVRAWFVL